jgi:hypothetical protein
MGNRYSNVGYAKYVINTTIPDRINPTIPFMAKLVIYQRSKSTCITHFLWYQCLFLILGSSRISFLHSVQ